MNIQFFYGSKSQLPASGGVPGRLFFTTDTKHIYWDNGEATLIDLYESDISAIKNLIGADAVATQIANAIDTFKTGTIGTLDEGKTVVQMIKAIENELNSTNTEGETIAQRLSNVESAVEVLNGSGEGSVTKTAADALAAYVAESEADFATLKEVAEWIAADKTGANELQTAVSTLNGDKTVTGSVASTVTAAINELDVPVSVDAGEGKYIKSITQVDGKIVPVYATLPESNISWVPMGDSSATA